MGIYQTYEQEKEEALAFEHRVATEGWDSVQDSQEAYYLADEHRDQEYILTDRDVWHLNPFYQGKPGPHPEDDPREWEDEDTYYSSLDTFITD